MARGAKGKGKAPLSEPIVDHRDDSPDAQDPVDAPGQSKRKMEKAPITPRKKKKASEEAIALAR